MKTRIKICCISSKEEAKLAIEYGAHAVGLVGKMPSGPGPIPDELIADIVKTIPPAVSTFLLTSETNTKDVIAHHQKVLTNTIQMVDALESGEYKEIHEHIPGIKLVQVIHVLNDESLDEALSAAEYADALLLDSGNPNLAIKELGGTGRTHSWTISRRIVEQCGIPVFLAGGLNAMNVCEAIEFVQPFGVDLCTGVRSNGKLDKKKLEAFFKAVDN